MEQFAAMHERRLIALALVVAGVWLQWGPGFALIIGGVGYGSAGVELGPRVDAARTGIARSWARIRGTAAAVPRRTAAAALVALAAAMLPTAAFLALGIWAAVGVFGALSLVFGTVLGWE